MTATLALTAAARPRAVIQRMLTPEHRCASGLKALHLLRARGFDAEGRVLPTRAAVDAFKAAYVDRREQDCACVGGGSNVPLGFVSLTENLLMVAMGLWVAA